MTSTQTFTGTTRNGETVAVITEADGWRVAINGKVHGRLFDTIESAHQDADLYCLRPWPCSTADTARPIP